MPPTLRNLNAGTFACGFCLEEKVKRPRPINVAGDDICIECIDSEVKPMFSEALENENSWPVKWGGTTLKLEDLPGFSANFKMKWVIKEWEYRTPHDDRLYCRHKINPEAAFKTPMSTQQVAKAEAEGIPLTACDKYLGSKRSTNNRFKLCPTCIGRTCAFCGDAVLAMGRTCAHVVAEENAFKDLVRGRDYQTCPSCQMKVELSDGCNSMVCGRHACMTHLCFICGQGALHDSDHWRRGRPCPRWNQPGSNNAHHDFAGEIPRDLA